MCVNGGNNISFGSKALQLREIDKLNRQFCLEYLHIPSSTKMDLKYDIKYRNYNEDRFIPEKYLEKSKNLFKRILDLRKEFEKSFTTNEDKDYKLLKSLIKKYKGANCRELVELIRYQLLEKGIDCKKIGLDVLSKDKTKIRIADNHVFLVANLKEDAQIEKPSTWGSKAIVIDPWAQMVSYATEGIKKMEINFGLDESNEYFKFYRVL